jgi:hypothetical protein
MPPPPDIAGLLLLRMLRYMASASITRPPQSVTKIARLAVDWSNNVFALLLIMSCDESREDWSF